jgi:folate-binding protein YgfZ
MTEAPPPWQGTFLDLSARAKFRITGTDRFRFLNGQITNDLLKASDSIALEACVLSAKGKMDAHIFVSVLGECLLVDAAPSLRQKLRARLERYVIADDVEIEDVTDRFSLFHILSSGLQEIEDCRIVSVRRFTEPGWDIWSDAAHRDPLSQRLASNFEFLDPGTAEVSRIEQGIPCWGSELTEEIIPVEANLEQRTIDYQKGCYIGQEVISRIKMSGQTNKRLCGLISLNKVPLQPRMKLADPSAPGREIGWITSATRSEALGKEIALGYVKRGFNSVGMKLDALAPGDAGNRINVSVEVVSLPFL